MGEGVSSVEAVVDLGVGVQGFARGAEDGEGVEIVAQHFGAEILLGGEPGDAGEMFQVEAMFDPFERLPSTGSGQASMRQRR